MKTLYVSDLDGTLLNRQAQLSAYTAGVIRELVAAGVPFSYATARSYDSAIRVTEALGMDIPVIVYNGARIVRQADGTALASCAFAEDEAEALRTLLDQLKVHPLVYARLGGRDRVSWLKDHVNEGIAHYLLTRAGDPRLREVDAWEALFQGETFYLSCIGPRDELAPIEQALRHDERFFCTLQQEIYRPEYWCEIMPREATKAHAARRLRTMLGCDRLIAFGDAVNDIPLFEAADACYAVQNAVDALKQRATGVIDSNEADGVARWLEQHVLHGQPVSP